MPSPKSGGDPDFERFDFRAKSRGFPLWKGVDGEGDRDPAAQDANKLVDAINIRPVLDGYKCRGGLDKTVTVPATSDLDGLWEAGDIGAAEEHAIGDIDRDYLGYLIATPWWEGTSSQRMSIDPAQTPVALAVAGSTYHYANALFNSNRLYLIKRNVADPDRVSELRQVTGFTTESLIWSTPTPLDESDGIQAICVAGALLYMAGVHIRNDNSWVYRVWTWTGAGTPAVDRDFSGAAGGALSGAYPNSLFLFTYGTGIVFAYKEAVTNNWVHWYRTAAGAWSTIALATPGTDIVTYEPYGGAEHGAVLYVLGDAFGPLVAPDTRAYIKDFSGGAAYGAGWQYVGAGVAGRNRPLVGAVVFNGYLYYGAKNDNIQYLARLNLGTGINDETHYNMLGLPSTITGGVVASAWTAGGNLYMLVHENYDTGVNHERRRLYHSNGTDTTSWTLDTNTEDVIFSPVNTTKQEPVLPITGINLS